jgi:hypothetical protein
MTEKPETSLVQAAIIAGLGLLISVIAAPYAELYVYPKLIIPFNPAATAKNIIENEALFISGIFAYLITFIFDLIISWALYVLLKPVNKSLSMLVAGFRIVYTVLALVALNNLVTALNIYTNPQYLGIINQDLLYAEGMIFLRAFRNHWYFAIILFGIHLVLLGYLVFKSVYIPKVLGVLLIITGIGYLLTSMRPYLFSGINIDFAKYTFYGELIFMLWLLFRGRKIKPNSSSSAGASL